MKIKYLFSSLLIFGRCSANLDDEWDPSFMTNNSLTLSDLDEIERVSYPLHRYKRQGN